MVAWDWARYLSVTKTTHNIRSLRVGGEEIFVLWDPEVFLFLSQTQINVLNITDNFQQGQNIDTMRYYIT